MTTQNKTKIVRNIIIFYVGTLLLSIGGGIIMASGQEAGGLLFILSPFLMVLVVRFLLGDGWKDAGLRLNVKKNRGWYLFALLSMPIIFLVVIAMNILLGFTSLAVAASEVLPLLLAGFAMQLVPRMFFSLTEEWGWRGYLEPRLARLGMPDGQRHVVVGILWGIWHFPLILSTDYTSVPLAIFLPLFVVGTILLAFINGRMRQASGSVWPVVLMHGMANTLGFAILEGGLISYKNELLGNIVPGSITITIVYGLIAVWIMRRRQTSLALTDGGTAVPQPIK